MSTSGTSPASGAAGSAADGGRAPARDGSLAVALMQTAEVRGMVRSALPRLLSAWAGRSRLRRVLAAILGKTILGGFEGRGEGEREPSIRGLLREPERARQLATQLPGLLNRILYLATAASEAAASLAPEEKARLRAAVLENVDLGRAGALLTTVASIANEAEAADPGRVAERLRPGFREWVRNVDFGELKARVDALAEHAPALAEVVNEELWRYPAKMVCILSLLPSGVNAGIRASARTVQPINRLAPDLVADVILSLVRDLKGEEVGRLINEACELVRKTHTGSVLIGDHGKPQLPEDLSVLIGDVLRSVDVELLLKARAMLAETGEATDGAVCALLAERPELARELIASRFRRQASALRRLGRRTDLLERALSDEEIAAAVTRGIGEVDAQELAETLSRLLAIVNRVRERSPGTIRETLSQTIASLDQDEARQAVRWLVEDVVAALEPLAPEIVPPVLRGITELLNRGGSAGDGELRRAVDGLREAFGRKEVAA